MSNNPLLLNRRTLLKSSMTAIAGLTLAPSLLWAARNTTATPSASERESLIQQLSKETGLPQADIAATIKQAQFDASIITRIQTPYESRTYAEYRPLFVHERLARKGRDFMRQHATIFAASEKQYGVQKEIIAAILGMETRYGVNQGRDLVVNSLFTLATGYPRRASFFRKELGQLLLLCQEEGLKPLEFKGSYAGAFGVTQFIPSSYRAYAVDADGDGKRDVWHSPSDIINSVANYFQRHGWDGTQPLAHWLPTTTEPALLQQAQQGFKQWVKLSDIQHLLPKLDARWQPDAKVTLVEMTTQQGPIIVLVHYNFYVITRWNRSYNYAMAITELAELMDCKACQTHA